MLVLFCVDYVVLCGSGYYVVYYFRKIFFKCLFLILRIVILTCALYYYIALSSFFRSNFIVIFMLFLFYSHRRFYTFCLCQSVENLSFNITETVLQMFSCFRPLCLRYLFCMYVSLHTNLITSKNIYIKASVLTYWWFISIWNFYINICWKICWSSYRNI